MAANGLKYLYPSDDWFFSLYRSSPSSITFGGTADPDYPVANVGDGDPSNPFKTPDDTATIQIALGGSHPIGVCALIHTNLKPGLTGVTLVGSGSHAFPTVPEYQEDGHPTNLIVELPAEESAATWQIQITSSNGVGLSIGEIVLAPSFRVLDADYQLGASDEEEHPTIDNESELGGVFAPYEQLIRRRYLRGTIRLQHEDDAEPIVRLRRAARGRGLPFLIDPQLPIAEPWYVRWADPRRTRSRIFQQLGEGSPSVNRYVGDYPIAFEEAGRGLPPEPVPDGA